MAFNWIPVALRRFSRRVGIQNALRRSVRVKLDRIESLESRVLLSANHGGEVEEAVDRPHFFQNYQKESAEEGTLEIASHSTVTPTPLTFTPVFSVDFTNGGANLEGFTIDNTDGGLWHLSTGHGNEAGHSATDSL